MTRIVLPALTAFALSLAACATPQVDPAIAPIVGKTLTSEGADVMVNADGTLTGKTGKNRDQSFAGVYEMRDGQLCRTLTERDALPQSIPTTECQDVSIAGDQVTFTGPSGRSSSFTIQ